MTKYILKYQHYDNGHYESITLTSESRTEIDFRVEKLRWEFEEKTWHSLWKLAHLEWVREEYIDKDHLANLTIIRIDE